MKKKIIVITTGGTIGSILQPGSVSVDLTKRRISQEIANAMCQLGYSVEIISPLNKNSESFAPVDWKTLLDTLNVVNDGDADGIVVTHGTDTMIYSIAATIVYSDLWKKNICFTGAFHSPDHPSSDTSLSLLSALTFAASGYPGNGIYVAFRANSLNNEAYIANGADLKPMAFDETHFEAAYGDVVATFVPERGLSECIPSRQLKYPTLGVSHIPSRNDIENAQRKIACLSLYPGIDKDFLINASKGKEIIVVQTYHCGTGPADDDYIDVIEYIKSHNILVLMATFPIRNICPPYGSTNRLKAAGAHIYSDLQPHFLYVFSLLSLSVGLSSENIIKRLSAWRL